MILIPLIALWYLRIHRHYQHAREQLIPQPGHEPWSAGIGATQLAGTEELRQTHARRLLTAERLRIAGHLVVFAVGDVVSVRIDGHEILMLSRPRFRRVTTWRRRSSQTLEVDRCVSRSATATKGTMAVVDRNAVAASIGRLRSLRRLAGSPG